MNTTIVLLRCFWWDCYDRGLSQVLVGSDHFLVNCRSDSYTPVVMTQGEFVS